MKLIFAACMLVLGLASPLPANTFTELDNADPSNAPIDWDGPEASTSVKCGNNTYNGTDIYFATQHAVNLGLLSPPETRGFDKYPRPFDHDNSTGVKLHFPKPCPANDQRRQEFPLVTKGPYDGGNNSKNYGDERVIFYYDGQAQGVDGHPLVHYCGLLTHKGAPRGGFVQCPGGK